MAARGMIAGLICLLLAHIRTFLGLAVIFVTAHVVGLRAAQIDPYNRVTRTVRLGPALIGELIAG